MKGADGLSASQRAGQRVSRPRVMPSAWREKILYLASKKKIQITDKSWTVSSEASKKVLRSSSLEHLLVVWYHRDAAADPVFFRQHP